MIWIAVIVLAWIAAFLAAAAVVHRRPARRDIPWIPYHCTQPYCPVMLPSPAAVDRHLRVDHDIPGGA